MGRITGLATGMDIDALVVQTMKPYRIKIEKQQQQKDILEIKQQLYRDLINDSRELYNKYFDVSKKDSILLSKNWNTVKFTSSDENVLTVTGNSEAKAGNYKVTGNTGTAARAVVSTSEITNNKITINGKEFELKGDTDRDKANHLNEQLKKAGINVTVKYSDMAGTAENANKSGFIFESTVIGSTGNFTIGGTVNSISGTVEAGKNATGAMVTGFNVSELKPSGKISVDGKEIDITISDIETNEDIEKILNEKLKDYKLTAKVSDTGDITFTTTDLGSKVEDPKISVNGKGGTFTKGEDGTATKDTVSVASLSGVNNLGINNNVIDISGIDLSTTDGIDKLNELLKKDNMGVTAKLVGGNIEFTSNTIGADGKIELKSIDGAKAITKGIDTHIKVEDGKGGVYTHTGTSNSFTVDGITFTFDGEIPAEGITVKGKNDVDSVKDNVVNFINDYNKLIEKLNTITSEKRNKNYDPLTADQKKEMSEDEIKLWNEKVKQGQLYKDNDVSRIANSMKEAMRGMIDGMNLESIGIKPVSDYSGTKNGTYTIDEDKLTKALENDSEQVMKLFTSTPPADESLSEAEKLKSTGIAQRLKNVLYNETVTVSSPLIKKAGVLGSATATNNDLTDTMKKYERKIKDMEKAFSTREQQLYSKWAKVETLMNQLNSQQSYLSSFMGS